MVDPEEPRAAVAPAIAIWTAASLVAVVAFALLLAAERAIGWGRDAISEHDAVAVLPHAASTAAATLLAALAQAYVAGFYVRSLFPSIGARWIKCAAVGAVAAAALAYANAEVRLATIRELGVRALVDPARTDPSLAFFFAAAAAIGVAQAVALRPASRRFLAWPFVAVFAAALGVLLARALRPVLVTFAVPAVLGAAATGVALGASFAVLARGANLTRVPDDAERGAR